MNPYEGLTDDQVLARARNACRLAASLPPGSTARAIQWGVFDAAMAELGGRAMRLCLEEIHKREQADGEGAEGRM